MNYNLNTLEFNEVLEILKKYAHSNLAKSLIDEITPINSFEEIKSKLDMLKCAYESIVKYCPIPLSGLVDIKRHLQIASLNSTLDAFMLLDIVSFIDGVSNVLKYRSELHNCKVDTKDLDIYFNELTIQKELKQQITLTIDQNAKVVDNASLKLFKIRKNIKMLENRLTSKMNEIMTKEKSKLNETLIVSRNDRLCLPVKAEFKHAFRGIIHDESQSHTTVYIEPEACIEINLQIINNRHDELIEVNNILLGLTLLVNTNCEELSKNLEILTNLDVIFAKAKMAIENDYNYPKINTDKVINIVRGKHPLISKEKVVPIDIEIGKSYNTIIITGPNTGGKTVCLKTVGLLTIMMQSGMFVPCSKDSSLAIFDNVFVDIGDDQSILQSLSTFSSHITKIINIVNNLDHNSLVLLDELGSGTDPNEGSSLAISIIEHLSKYDTRTIVTSHYTSLKEYALNTKNVTNASVEFNPDTLMPTYRLITGIGGKSNAIMISKRLGLDQRIIDNALRIIKDTKTDNSMLIEKLQDEQLKISNIKEDLTHKISEYNKLLDEVNIEKQELSKKQNTIIDKARKEASKVIEKAKKEAFDLISKINIVKENPIKEHELADLKHQARSLKTENKELDELDFEIKEGDIVFIKAYEKYAKVLKVKKDKYEVNLGNFTISFKKDELIKTFDESKNVDIIRKKAPSASRTNHTSNDASYRIDLRGMRFSEVADILDKKLDEAYLNHYSSIQIIHGFGSGALRKATIEYLKKSSYVKSFRSGEEGEGLNGTTVVYLK